MSIPREAQSTDTNADAQSWILTSQVSPTSPPDPACYLAAESPNRLWLGSSRRAAVFSLLVADGTASDVLPIPSSCFAGQTEYPDAAGSVREVLRLPDGPLLNVSSYAVTIFSEDQQTATSLFASNVLQRLLTCSGGPECILAASIAPGGPCSPLLILTTEKNFHVFDVTRCDTPFTSFALPPFLRNCRTLASDAPLKFWVGGGTQGCIGCFDLRQRRSAVRRVVDAHRRAVTSLDLSGNVLVSTGLDRDVHDLLQHDASLQPYAYQALESHNKDILGVAIDHGLASPDRAIKLWDHRHLSAGNVPMRSIEMPLGRGPMGARFVPSGELVVVGSDGNWLSDSQWHSSVSIPEYYTTPISSPLVAFDIAAAPNDRLMAAVDLNYHTYIWSPRRYASPSPTPDPRRGGNLSPYQLQLLSQLWERQQASDSGELPVPCPSTIVYPSEVPTWNPDRYRRPTPPKELPKSRPQPPRHLAFHPPEYVERAYMGCLRRDPLGRRSFRYNREGFPGLENGTSLDFVHPTLMALYLVDRIRSDLIEHNCDTEFCLACELGFLFHMMDLARLEGEGMPCQTINFHRALKHSSEPRVLGITDNLTDLIPEAPDHSYERHSAPMDVGRRAQVFARFILEHLHKELKRSKNITTIDGIFGHRLLISTKCQKCQISTVRESRSFSNDLDYSSTMKSMNGNLLGALSQSLRKRIQTRSFCKECNTSTSSEVIKQVESHPNILVVNCNIHSFAEIKHWRRFNETIPSSFWLSLRPSDPNLPVVVQSSPPTAPDPSWRKYELIGSIFNVEGEDSQDIYNANGDISEHITVPIHGHVAMHCRRGAEDWLALNDFVVTATNESEVVRFSDEWKVPITLWFGESISLHTPPDVSPRDSIKLLLSTFMRDENISSVPANRRHPATFVPLDVAELQNLVNGDFLVGLDAEFVAEERDVTPRGGFVEDLAADLEPSNFALARVTVIRGQGPMEGVPFIDHYIHAKEAPKNYLTKYSGLKEGDLDPMTCRHWLTTKKAIYQKLRFLVDAGCKFVGHGLWKDFRIINMFVPSIQQLDTVELFRLPRQRFLSLKFLVYHLLGKAIQTETHDSIQDAQCALALYKYYQDLVERDCLKECLDHLYTTGYQLGWEVHGPYWGGE